MSQIARGVLSFKLEVIETAHSDVTAYAGVPLVLEQARVVLRQKNYRELRKALGYHCTSTVRRHVESMVVLLAAGGDCIDDVRTLRADAGLRELIGFELSSPTQLKDFLYRFHQDERGQKLTAKEDAELSQAGKAQIRPEGPGLKALAKLMATIVERVQKLRPHDCATLDVDATIVEAEKKNALCAYEGTRGYQPQMAWWAEQEIWTCDQFRDGNVPAEFDGRAFLQHAFGTLPAGLKKRRLRGDSALYNEKALTWADEQGIQFAVSADMSEALSKAVRRLPESVWAPYRTLRAKERTAGEREERQWAEVEFIPDWAKNRKKNGETLRYLAIRVRSRQRDLFTDDATWRHFAVVTNLLDWDGERLLRWQREKQGTVEHGHGVIKCDLAGGTLPCSRFGSNAAWWRLNLLVHDLLELLKAEALPSEFHSLRPKALRFRFFNVAGRLLHGARQLILRLNAELPSAVIYARAREILRLALRRSVGPTPSPA
jgi:hypothetical protein